jgi:hypothetical protein
VSQDPKHCSHTLDLHALMPYHSMANEESRDETWDDGLHFTQHGYSIIGDHIASRLVDLMAESQARTNLETKNAKAEHGDVAQEA